MDWLDLRQENPSLIASASGQVPPRAEEPRITEMRELVERFGRY